ncbi:hypothetical protein MKZ38_005377 [Zalerion maritima]|uniref:Uncharacterized protein n=1 Tax=Zalerion maritima TaxID=339359 RepID=A0AAD5WWN8_9PEZI|nr:hypothetical protein MKZ38_005377 [Zalerion maritima]
MASSLHDLLQKLTDIEYTRASSLIKALQGALDGLETEIYLYRTMRGAVQRRGTDPDLSILQGDLARLHAERRTLKATVEFQIFWNDECRRRFVEERKLRLEAEERAPVA